MELIGNTNEDMDRVTKLTVLPKTVNDRFQRTIVDVIKETGCLRNVDVSKEVLVLGKQCLEDLILIVNPVVSLEKGCRS